MRWPRRTLLSKIFLLQAAVLCVVAVVVPVAIDAMLRARVSYFETKVLSDRGTLIVEALAFDPDGRLRLKPVRYDREGERGEFGFVVLDGAEVLVASSDFAAGLLRSFARAEAPVFGSVEDATGSFDVLSRPIEVDGRRLWLVLGWNTSEQDVIFDDVAQGFLWHALALTVPLLALLLALDAWMVRRFFRPVRALKRQIEARDPAKEDWRLPDSDLPAEILPLVRAYNEALGTVERSYRLQKEFTADAAHELRTPMAVLDARLQTLPPSEARDALLADVRLMTRIVAQLLDMARVDQDGEAEEEADLLATCHSVVEALALEAIRNGQSLGLDAPDGMTACRVRAREQDLWHMVRNLVENAIRHTPAGTTIDVKLAADGTLTVEDDGPGIPKELHAHIFRRFWRRKRSGGSGAGLGMAIVQRVAQANGGSITLESDEGMGTRFIIRLPRANDGV